MDPAWPCPRVSSEHHRLRASVQLVALALVAGALQLAAKSDYILIIDCGSSGTRMCVRRRCRNQSPCRERARFSLATPSVWTSLIRCAREAPAICSHLARFRGHGFRQLDVSTSTRCSPCADMHTGGSGGQGSFQWSSWSLPVRPRTKVRASSLHAGPNACSAEADIFDTTAAVAHRRHEDSGSSPARSVLTLLCAKAVMSACDVLGPLCCSSEAERASEGIRARGDGARLAHLRGGCPRFVHSKTCQRLAPRARSATCAAYHVRCSRTVAWSGGLRQRIQDV